MQFITKKYATNSCNYAINYQIVVSVNIVCSFLLFSINQAYDTRGAFGLTRSVERLDTGRYRHHGATTINYRSYLLVQGKDLSYPLKKI